MNDCVFCRILAGELPASFVYRDDRCAAFMDIRPVNIGHLLVIPTRHAASLADIDPSEAADIMKIGHTAAAALRASGVRCEGVNLFLADGAAAMQTVFHVHIHAVPRRHGDKLSIASRAIVRRSGDLERAAEHVRTGLARLDRDRV